MAADPNPWQIDGKPVSESMSINLEPHPEHRDEKYSYTGETKGLLLKFKSESGDTVYATTAKVERWIEDELAYLYGNAESLLSPDVPALNISATGGNNPSPAATEDAEHDIDH